MPTDGETEMASQIPLQGCQGVVCANSLRSQGDLPPSPGPSPLILGSEIPFCRPQIPLSVLSVPGLQADAGGMGLRLLYVTLVTADCEIIRNFFFLKIILSYWFFLF